MGESRGPEVRRGQGLPANGTRFAALPAMDSGTIGWVGPTSEIRDHSKPLESSTCRAGVGHAQTVSRSGISKCPEVMVPSPFLPYGSTPMVLEILDGLISWIDEVEASEGIRYESESFANLSLRRLSRG